MPDLDIIDRSVPPGWRKAAQLFKNKQADPRLVVRAANRAMAKSLRDHGGVPAAAECIQVLEDRLAHRTDPHSAHTRVWNLERRHGHERHVKVAAETAKQLLGEIERRRTARVPIRERFYEDFCFRLLDHLFLARIVPYLPGKHFASKSEAMERVRAFRAVFAPFLRSLARRLADQPDGHGLRASPVRLPEKPSTEQLLGTPIM